MTATDANQKTISNTYALKVIGALDLPAATLANGILASPYSPQIMPAVTGGIAPYTYSVTNLPPGLTFNSATREISGTPMLGGNYQVNLTATDAGGNVVNRDYGITITITAPIVANVTVCSGSSTTLTVANLQAGVTYTWYDATANTVLVVANNGTFTTPPLNANTSLSVEAVSGTAVSTRTNVAILVNPVLPVPNVIAVQPICTGSSTSLTVSNPDPAVAYKWFETSSGGTPIYTGTSFTTPSLLTNKVFYIEASQNGCVSPMRGAVNVVVSPRPSAPSVSSNNVSVCTGSTAVLTVNNASSNLTYTWYTSATGGAAVGRGASFTTPVITRNNSYYAEAASGTCTSTARTQVAVTALTIPIAPASVSVATNQLCAGVTTLLMVNNPDATLDYKWYANSSSGTMLAQGTSFTTPILNTATTYYVSSVSKVGGCSSEGRTPVTVNLLPVLEAPRPTLASSVGPNITFTWPIVVGAVSYEVSTDNGLTWRIPSTGPNGITHVVSALRPGQNISLLTKAKGLLSCQTAVSVPVSGTASNPFIDDLFIPNTFTPNGDGRNDLFMAYGNSVSKFRMKVYNRSGGYMFESNLLTTGWDGRWNGNLQPSGVYVYQMETTFNDGVTKLFKGTVTLLR